MLYLHFRIQIFFCGFSTPSDLDSSHLLISAVSKAWRESYDRVARVQLTIVTCWTGTKLLVTITPQTTLYSAIFASPASVRLAYEHGFAFKTDSVRRIAGQAADVPTLKAARELGLAFSDYVANGAAESGSVLKLQWLHIDQACPLPLTICEWAASSGNIDMLRWLQEHGRVPTTDSFKGAALGGHLHVVQFLRDEGCEWSEDACITAANMAQVSALQWLHEQGCPWDIDTMCGEAAYGGSIETLLYLRQQGCEYNEDTMHGAAQGGVGIWLCASSC
jgi:hypothetical protein